MEQAERGSGRTGGSGEPASPDDITEVLRQALVEAGFAYEDPAAGNFVATLPGVRKLNTTCSLKVGTHSLSVNAFVARRPDENHEAVYRWLLATHNNTPRLAL